MTKRLSKHHETCPMLARSDWGVGGVQSKGLSHALSLGQSPVGFHGPRVAGWLVFLNGCHRGEDMRLPIGETKLGSAWINDQILTGVGIGSQHCVIRMGVGEGVITPLSHDRIIRINNQTITDTSSLSDGALITIGELHAIVRFAEIMGRGYAPPEAPKPQGMATQASQRETVCGWLVMTRGVLLGVDFRLVSGPCRIGSDLNLEVTVPDPHLEKHIITLLVSPKDCKVSWIAEGHKILVNGNEVVSDTVIKDSDVILMDHVEAYLKWFRA
jgi:hypothetical protein